MNTFLNIQQECNLPCSTDELKQRLIAAIKEVPIIERIYIRGLYEQHRIKYYPNYADQKKRISKNY